MLDIAMVVSWLLMVQKNVEGKEDGRTHEVGEVANALEFGCIRSRCFSEVIRVAG